MVPVVPVYTKYTSSTRGMDAPIFEETAIAPPISYHLKTSRVQ